MDSNANSGLPEWLSFALAFVSVGPLMLLFSVQSIKVYGGVLGNLWERFVAPRLSADSYARRHISFGVLAGMVAGALSVGMVNLIHTRFFPEISMVFRAKEPIAILTQIAFVQAGLLEEVAKNFCGLLMALLVCRTAVQANAQTGAPSERPRFFLKSTPFLFAGVGLGFALLENQLYLEAYAADGPGPVFFARALMATTAHALLNLYFGLALLDIRQGDAWGFARIAGRALLVVVLWHGAYDFFALPPVALFQSFTVLILALLIWTTGRDLYRRLPEIRYRGLRSVAELEAEAAEAAGDWTPRQRPIPAANDRREGAAPAASASGSLSESMNWERAFAVLPQPPADFAAEFARDRWRLRFPQGESEPPYELSEFHGLSPRVLATLAGPGQPRATRPARLPRELAREWAADEAWWSQLFGVGGADTLHSVWDTSCLNRHTVSTAELAADLQAAGVDLTQTVPFQLLEYRLPPGSAARLESNAGGEHTSDQPRHVWVSSGLSALYGRELLIGWSHPHPMMRWFFLRLASLPPDQAFWLRDFAAFQFPGDPTALGDPRGWLRFFATVPFFDPISARILTSPRAGVRLSLTDANRANEAEHVDGTFIPRRDAELPLQVLMFGTPDAQYVARRGVAAYLQTLRHLGYVWHNDFRRPPLRLSGP